MSIAAASFFLLTWILYCALTPAPYDKLDYILYLAVYGVSFRPILSHAPNCPATRVLPRESALTFLQVFTVPIVPFVLLNVPQRVPLFWQIWLALATWVLPDVGIIQTRLCSFVFTERSGCADPTQLIVLASAIGQSTLAILALGQTRTMTLIAFVQFFALTGGLLFRQGLPGTLYRDVIYCRSVLRPPHGSTVERLVIVLVYHLFLLGICFTSERSSRRLFDVREQLKMQCIDTRAAQMKERKASDLTKRFVSYSELPTCANFIQTLYHVHLNGCLDRYLLPQSSTKYEYLSTQRCCRYRTSMEKTYSATSRRINKRWFTGSPAASR